MAKAAKKVPDQISSSKVVATSNTEMPAANTRKLPVWPNMFQAEAWVVYRDESFAAGIDSWNTSTVHSWYGAKESDAPRVVGRPNELTDALKSAKIVGYGIRKGSSGLHEEIAAIDWHEIRPTALELDRNPFHSLKVKRDVLFAFWPALNSQVLIAKSELICGDKGSVSDKTNTNTSFISNADLQEWISLRRKSGAQMGQKICYRDANIHFEKLGKSVARERVIAALKGTQARKGRPKK
jgi:hypothetical protein